MSLSIEARKAADNARTASRFAQSSIQLAIEPRLHSAALGETGARPKVESQAENLDSRLASAAAAGHGPVPARSLRLPMAWFGLAAAGIAAYLWYQLDSGGEAAAAQVAAAPRPTSQVTPALTLPPANPGPEPEPIPAASQQPARHAAIDARPVPAAAARPAAPQAEGGVPIRLVRSRPEIDPHLKQGHLHLEAGELAAARTEYELAYANDPRNADTLLGLAVLAQREGRSADADSYYRQALEANPKNAAAQAAAIAHSLATDPAAAESRAKNLLAAQPDSGPLNFSLGNLYSRQSRWAEAQQMYFNAVAADGDNPDYLFNLAISLDHLRQPRLAARHYQLALQAAERRPAAFDRALAAKRLQTLQ